MEKYQSRKFTKYRRVCDRCTNDFIATSRSSRICRNCRKPVGSCNKGKRGYSFLAKR